MRLSREQQIFTRHLVQLLNKAFEMGLEVTMGEILRTEAQQAIYIREGKSRTSNSMHLKKCAADLNIFRDGTLIRTPTELGKFWESLDSKNRWGGSWRGLIEAKKSTFVDAPHFERAVG